LWKKGGLFCGFLIFFLVFPPPPPKDFQNLSLQSNNKFENILN